MSETKAVKIWFRDRATAECTVTLLDDPPWSLRITGLSLDKEEFSGEDLFDAFMALRKELEKREARLLCVGAQQNVWPSGMSRSMGGGRKAYLTAIGAPAHSALVDIFDYAEPETVVTVAEQETYHQRWVDSLRP